MPASRPARTVKEWPLLILSIAIVAAICFPMWQGLSDAEGGATWSSWTPERWGRLLLGPEQVACYCCCTWAVLIFASRFLEVRRQRAAFGMSLLPTEEGARILHEDARVWQRQLDQVTQQKGSFILTNLIRSALSKYAISRSSKESSETVRHQADIEQGRMVSSMATMHYLAWAIPAIGFLGTVRGLAGMISSGNVETNAINEAVTRHLNVAFDCTLIALALSLVVMFLLHTIQREEEALVIDCQEYCLEHLINRMYEPEVATEDVGRLSTLGEERPFQPSVLPKRTTRIAP